MKNKGFLGSLFNFWRLNFAASIFLLVSISYSWAQTCASIDYNVTTIAAGGYHTVAVKEGGSVVAAGDNGYGQMNISNWTNIKAVAAGMYHTVGLKDDGTVVATGNNWYGQLNVSNWSNIKAVAAGTYHTVGLKDDGTVVATGSNSYGQLNVSNWTNIKAIAAGTYHTVGLKDDGTVVATGSNSYGQLNVSNWSNIKAVAAGGYHTVGLKDDGTVVATGSNSYGQLNVLNWSNIKAVAAGGYHTVGLKKDGTIVAVGDNSYGQLNVSNWSNITEIAAGRYHTVALKEDGTAMAVGSNEKGQLNVAKLANVKAFAGGWWGNIVSLTADGTVATNYWGSTMLHVAAMAAGGTYIFALNEDGTVVVSDMSGYQTTISALTGVKAIAAGGYANNWYYVLGIKEDGTVVGAGSNPWGQLNVSGWSNIKALSAKYSHTLGLRENGTVVAVGSASAIGYRCLDGWTNITAIAAGGAHAVGLKEDGTVVACGTDFYGSVSIPNTWTGIKAIAAGGQFTVGLKEDGTVLVAGASQLSQLVAGWTNIKAINAGWDNIVALKEDGSIVAAGAGANQLQSMGAGWSNIKQPVCSVPMIAAPSSLSASDVSCDNGGSISLSWTLSQDDPAVGAGSNEVTGYNVYKSETAGGPYSLIGNVAAGVSNLADNTAANGIAYYYAVRATDGVNESADSNVASAASSRNLPLPPANLTSSDTPYDLGGSITLGWTKSTDDGAELNNVVNYSIYRYSSTDGNITNLASLPAGTSGYIDNTTSDNETYFYYVKAYDGKCSNGSDMSNIAEGRSINNFATLPRFIGTLPGIAPQLMNSLVSKVENALAAFERGNIKAALNILNALLAEISAQSGKGIESSTAQILTAYVQNLIAYINAL